MNKSQITIPNPKWGSSLVNIILNLEKLRTKELFGEVPPYIFFQLKEIFHMLETLGSSRIEGNHTTLSEFVEKVIHSKDENEEDIVEINNLDKAINFIEKHTDETTPITRAYISEVHKIVTNNLTPPPNGEGSRSPGVLRSFNVSIKKSNHIPPDVTQLQEYFDNFLKFINHPLDEQYQLLMIAIAHHHFAFIHPFDNGNGRMGRLLNYALLIKLGFRVKSGRILNPSSVFYGDREKYFSFLSNADSLEEKDILSWAEYFLSGLKNEIEKIDSLLSLKYVREKVLLPAINFALDRENITQKEHSALKLLISKDEMVLKSKELSKIGIEGSLEKSRFIAALRGKRIIEPIKENGRIYTIVFANNYLLRAVTESLQDEGFISDFLNTNK